MYLHPNGIDGRKRMKNELLDEIYKVREKLAKESKYDVKKLAENVRQFALKNKLKISSSGNNKKGKRLRAA